MSALLWLFFLFVLPILLWLVFLALSSCLGTNFRASISGITLNPRRGAYDTTLFRTMTNHPVGAPSSEHIEMESMLNERMYPEQEYDD